MPSRPTPSAPVEVPPTPYPSQSISPSSPPSSSSSGSSSSSEQSSPKQLAANLKVPPSPAPTTLSFKHGDDAPKMREVDRDTPAAPRPRSGKKEITRKKSMKGAEYYGEVFAVREKEPVVPKAAGIIAELRTNVILEDEFTFAASLSRFLATRYQRPESSIVLSLTHSACMITGGTFDGTYILSITSPVSISPTCNKRNASLLADWFATNLGVTPARGFVKFSSPEWSDLACGGSTVLDLMEKEERARIGSAEKSNMMRRESTKRSMARGRSRRGEGVPSVVAEADEWKEKRREPGLAVGGKLKRRSMFNLFSRS